MFHRWAAPLLVLALCAMSPKTAAGQTQVQKPRGQSAGALGRNYPNPLNPETFIPFAVDTTGGCSDGSRQHVVSLRIYNILMQHVASGVLQVAPNSTTNVPAEFIGRPLTNLRLGCGAYVAYWNGKVDANGKEAASGTYVIQLIVDGSTAGTIRIFVGK